MNRIGLFFGSFNPLHNGHLHIARSALLQLKCSEIWFVISPLNPLKDEYSLFPATDRLNMVKEALKEIPEFKVCDIEFSLPKPSFTVDTLDKLREIYPSYEFILIIGSDSLDQFSRWKNYLYILENYQIAVYPRKPNYTIPEEFKKFNIIILNDIILDISSTLIREMIINKSDFSHLVPQEIYNYLYFNSLKKKK